MSRDLTRLAVIAGLFLSPVSASAQDVPPCRLRSVNVEHAYHLRKSAAAVGLLCLQGSRKAVHLEIREAPVAAVLSALSTAYKISYHSSIALTEIRDGVYAGSLEQVISHLLNDYDYVIKPEKTALDVFVFGQKGEQAVPAPIAAEYGETPARPAARNSRTH
jgi:hypothetical protein